MSDVRLSLLVVPGDVVNPLTEGEVKPEGIDLTVTRQGDGSTAYWRQLKFEEFDVSVMSVMSYIIAKSRGFDAIALPVFASRRFMHTDISYHVDSGVKTAGDLVGKRIGVGEYQQTAAVWLRGVLEHDFGVSQYKVDWYMERSEELSHGGSTGFEVPEGISFQRVPPEKSLASMLVANEIDAAPVGRAFREATNIIDRSTTNRGVGQDWSKVQRLFPDRMAECIRFYEKYGCVPATQMYVIKGEVDREHPWAAFNLYEAFNQAKEIARSTMAARIPEMLVFGADYLANSRKILGDDPFVYGVKANRAMFETLINFAAEQGLITEKPAVDELFALAVRDL
jgi:4,5-dihydroxyphthalate decarboxylase